jgi:hypothetical protein
MYRSLLALTVAAGLFTAAGAHAEVLRFHAKLDGAQQSPPVDTKGVGTATVRLNTVKKTVSYTVTFHHLSGPVTMAHFHGPADPGANAGVQVPLTGKLTTPIRGTATLTDAQIADLEAGKYYINLHTAADPNGEIRGQVLPTK